MIGHRLIDAWTSNGLTPTRVIVAKRWADIFCEQTLVAFISLAANLGFDRLEPLIEVLVQANLRAVPLNIGAEFIDLLS